MRQGERPPFAIRVGGRILSGTMAQADTIEPAASSASSGSGATLRAWIAGGAWLLVVIVACAGLVYGAEEQASGRNVFQQTYLSYLTGSLVAVVYGTVGLVLVVRVPRVVIGWLFLGIGAIAAYANFAWAYVLLGAEGSLPAGLDPMAVAWLANVLLAPGWLCLATLLILVFPDGRTVDEHWRPLIPVTIAIALLLAVSLAVTPGRLTFSFGDNPLGAAGVAGDVASVATFVLLVAMGGCAAAAAWSMRIRYLRAGDVQRQQLKWFAWASALVLIAGATDALLTGPWLPFASIADAAWVMFTFAAITLPIAALIAILRHGLYDIDRLIGRTFVYGALTAILAGMYAASMRLFEAVFKDVTGQTSDAALVITTLVLATTFAPIKARLEKVVDRRLGPADDSPAPAVVAPATMPDDLDARIEAIARRVVQEMQTTSPDRPEGSA
jgi:hypothetical protein